MIITTQTAEPRWGIWFRKNSRAPWGLIVSSGDRRAAEKLLVELASTAKLSGDWLVRRTDQPPQPIGRPGASSRE